MIELCCKYLFVRCIRLYVIIMSRTYFRKSPQAIFDLMSRNSDIWSISHCNRTKTHNHLAHKRILNHLVKLANWLNCVVSTYLYGVFDRMLWSRYVRKSEWMHILYFNECQRTPCSKKAQYLKFKLLQQNSNLHPLSS